jgi:hypothetical protein
VFVRGFVAMRIMSGLTVELSSMLCRMFAASRKSSMVSLTVIEVMVDMPVKMFRSVKPGTGADENPA